MMIGITLKEAGLYVLGLKQSVLVEGFDEKSNITRDTLNTCKNLLETLSNEKSTLTDVRRALDERLSKIELYESVTGLSWPF